MANTLWPGEWLRAAAARYARRPARCTANTSQDFATLYRGTCQRAAFYRRAGVRSQRMMAVVTRDATALTNAIYLGLALGTPVFPLDPRREDAARLLTEAGVSQGIADAGLVDRLPTHIPWYPADALSEPPEALGGGLAADACPLAADAVHIVLATSGTEGRARAVMLSGAAIAASVRRSIRWLTLGAGDRWLACLPMHHVGGMAIVLRTLCAGAGIVVHNGFEPAAVWDDVVRRRITHLSLVPAMLWRLLEHGGDRPPPPTLRCVLLGGSGASEQVIERALAARWPIWVSYGMTETCSHIALARVGREHWRPGHVGTVLPGVRVELVDESGRPVSGVGRLRVSGPMLMAGYATGDGIRGEGLNSAGAFLSADLGAIDRAGALQVVGRADDMLVSGGRNVHPCEVEHRLLGCPGVEDVAVSGRTDPVWGDVLVALVVGAVETRELDRWCRDNLPSSERPRAFRRVQSLPRNALGKLERGRLYRLVSSCET